MPSVKRKLISVARKTQRITYKQLAYWRHKNQILGQDIVALRSGEAPTFCRVNPQLNLPNQRTASLATLLSGFEDAGLQSWHIPTASNRATHIALASRDREAAIQTLLQQTHMFHWYWYRLHTNGRKIGGANILATLDPTTEYAGVRIYEHVISDESATFRAGPSQGVTVSFWAASENETLTAESWNDRLVSVPDPLTRNLDFSAVVDAANKPLIREIDFPIDAVYTWVDGSDRDWQRSKAQALHLSDTDSHIQNAVDEARFADHDELRYSLRSIEQYAPWINKIWIVTAGQTPEWLDTSNPRVEVVSHEQIWPDVHGLPSFNSHAIEANINSIAGLSEHYLYFNDDFLFGRPVRPESFYHGNGIAKIFESRAHVDFTDVDELDNASTIAAKNARSIIESTFGKTYSRKFFHVPTPVVKSVLADAEERFPEVFKVTRAASFRQSTDIAAVGSFYFNWAHAAGKAVTARISYAYIDPATAQGRSRFASAIARRQFDTICINDGSTEETPEERIETDKFIRKSLQEFLPVPSSFELK